MRFLRCGGQSAGLVALLVVGLGGGGCTPSPVAKPDKTPAADLDVATLPAWVRQPVGSLANPIGATVTLARCPSIVSAFQLAAANDVAALDHRDGVTRYAAALGRANAALAGDPSPPADGQADKDLPAPFLTPVRVLASRIAAQNEPVASRDTYETQVDYDHRVKAQTDASDARFGSQSYAVVLESYDMLGLDDLPSFSPSFPPGVRYDADHQAFSPPDTLERSEGLVYGSLNGSGEIVNEHTVTRKISVETPAKPRFSAWPTMAPDKAKLVHPGLVLIAVGHLAPPYPTTGEESDLTLKADAFELRDVCADKTLWSTGRETSVTANNPATGARKGHLSGARG